MPDLTDDQIKQVDVNVAELAGSLADSVGPLVFEYEASDGDPWGDAKSGDKYHSEQIYGSSYGPAAAEILWGDVAPEDEDDPDECAEQPEWADELCDELADQVSSILSERFPGHECSCAFWEDNCLMVVVSEE